MAVSDAHPAPSAAVPAAGARSAPPAIQTFGLTKSYGENRGVFDLDLVVEQGEIFGFLGPNSAGKTTTIRLLMDLIRPDSGKALVLGRDARHNAIGVHRLVGYLPGEFALDPRLSGRQTLTYLGNLRGGVDHAYVDALAQRLDVDLDRPFGHYSRGNKQKVGLIQAFMHRPRLLILDEPTGGLDPLNQESVNELVREARAAGSTVFFSSHILSEVEALCERVGFIRDGRLARVAVVRELVGLRLHHVEAECVELPAAEPLAALAEVGDLSVEGRTVRCTVRGEMQRLVAVLAGWGVRRLVSREPSLSEVFLNLYDAQGEA